MPITEAFVNPCCCITLRTGTLIVGVLDLIFAIIYIGRYNQIVKMKDEWGEFFPADYPTATREDYRFMYRLMVPWGSFTGQIISGIALLVGNIYFRYNFWIVSSICYSYIAIRALLIITFIAETEALMATKKNHFTHRAIEVIFGIIVSAYFIMVVAAFVCETRIDLNNYRAIKPINIEPDEHAAYLRNDKESRFNDATFYHVMTPEYFLNAEKKHAEGRRRYGLEGQHMDETMLQYLIENKQVEVVPEEEGGISGIPSKTSLPDSGSETGSMSSRADSEKGSEGGN